MWDWKVALYLFIGGLCAGLFVYAALVQLAHGARFCKTVRAASALCVLFLPVGVLLLLLEVGNPSLVFNVLASFSNIGTSWMARGFWIVVLTETIFVMYAAVAWIPVQRGSVLCRYRQVTLNVVGLLGILCSLMLAGYTGFLLMASRGIMVWQTPLLPAMFTVSGLDTGFSVGTTILNGVERHERIWARAMGRFEKIAVVILAAGLALLGLYICFAVGLYYDWTGFSVAMTVAVCVCLLMAFVLAAVRLIPAGRCIPVWLIAAFALLAGIFLRLTVVCIGVHTNPLRMV